MCRDNLIALDGRGTSSARDTEAAEQLGRVLGKADKWDGSEWRGQTGAFSEGLCKSHRSAVVGRHDESGDQYDRLGLRQHVAGIASPKCAAVLHPDHAVQLDEHWIVSPM